MNYHQFHFNGLSQKRKKKKSLKVGICGIYSRSKSLIFFDKKRIGIKHKKFDLNNSVYCIYIYMCMDVCLASLLFNIL